MRKIVMALLLVAVLLAMVGIQSQALGKPDDFERKGVDIEPGIKQISFGPCQCNVNYNDKGITHSMDCCNGNNCLSRLRQLQTQVELPRAEMGL